MNSLFESSKHIFDWMWTIAQTEQLYVISSHFKDIHTSHNHVILIQNFIQVSKAPTLVLIFYTSIFSLKNMQSGNALIKCHPP